MDGTYLGTPAVKCSFRETPWGVNLSLVAVFANNALQLLLEVTRLNSLCSACVGSADMIAAFFLTLHLFKPWMEARSALTIFFAGLIIYCSSDVSCFVDKPNHHEHAV